MKTIYIGYGYYSIVSMIKLLLTYKHICLVINQIPLLITLTILAQ